MSPANWPNRTVRLSSFATVRRRLRWSVPSGGTAMPRHDDADDGTPIRRMTADPDGPARWWIWVVFPVSLATVIVVVGILSYRSGRKSGLQDASSGVVPAGGRLAPAVDRGVPMLDTPNAKCPSCAKEWRISEEYRNNPSQFIREEMCPRCQTFFKVHFLYMAKDPNRTPKPPPFNIPDIVIQDK